MNPTTSVALFAFFQSPALLWGLAGASIPIIIHLFFRSRFRVVPWGAMKFLLTSIEQTSRRLKFQELLLLLVRCTLVGLLALALAGLTFKRTSGGAATQPVDVVLLVDTSYTMGAREQTSTRLDEARKKATKLLSDLPAHSTVQIIACSDRATVLGPYLPDDLETARNLLKELTVTSQASDLEKGIAEAASILERGQSPVKELYIFSDMQRPALSRQAGSISRSFESIKDSVAVTFVHSEPRKLQNVAVVSITPQTAAPRPGERCGFSVLLKNTGMDTLSDLRVGLFVNASEKNVQQFLSGEKKEARAKVANLETTALSHLAPGESRLVTLTGTLEQPGLHGITACVTGDDIPGDNRHDVVLEVKDQVQVLVVDGNIDTRDAEKSSSFYLLHAMTPERDKDKGPVHIVPKLVPPRLASPTDLEKSAVCVLVNCPMPRDLVRQEDDMPDAFVEALAKFVRSGKGLILFGGDKVNVDDYNRLLDTRHGLLPYRIRSIVDRGKDPVNLSRQSANLPSYIKFKDDDLFRALDAVAVWKYLDIDEPLEKRAGADGKKEEKKDLAKKDEKEEKKRDAESVTVALRYDNGAPAVVVRRVGAGEVVLVTTSADQGTKKGTSEPSWNLFSKTLGQMYVPFIQSTLAHLLQQQTQAFNVVAGESLVWTPEEKETRSYTLVKPDESEVRLGTPEKKNNRSQLTLTDFAVAGIYKLKTNEGTEKAAARSDAVVPLAVTPDLSETEDLESLSAEQIDTMYQFTPRHWFSDGNTSGGDQTAREFDMTYAKWLLFAVLFLLFFETGLAYWCSRGW